jgi:hypothetical protein
MGPVPSLEGLILLKLEAVGKFDQEDVVGVDTE